MTELFLALGTDRHGVTRHVLRLAAASSTPVARSVDEVPAGACVHVDLTDRLLAPRHDASEAAGLALLASLADRGCRVVLGLHDLPVDGAVRRRTYRRLAERADAVVVCSEVEGALLAALGRPADAVLPLPVEPATPMAGTPEPAASVTVLGFVWPGRGHDEVLAALPTGLSLVCLGEPAAGHDDLAAALSADPRVTVSGYLPEPELPGRLRAATIPVAPNRALAASASIGTWWEHGRRPLVPATASTRELLARHPGSLLRYDDLAGALASAAADPASTWLPPDVRPGWSAAAAAAARLAVGR